MTAQNPKRLSQLAWFAILGHVILFASAWLLPIVSEYGFVDDNISELALGRFGVVQTVALLIVGLGTLGLAVAIRQLTAGSRGSLTGSLLLGIYGAGAILSAIFPTDRIDRPADLSSLSMTGTIHVAVAVVSFVCAIVAMFVLSWAFMRQAQWRRDSRWWMLFPAGALALLIVQAEGPLVGLLQRMLVAVISAWLVLVALEVHSIVASAASRDLDPSDPAT